MLTTRQALKTPFCYTASRYICIFASKNEIDAGQVSFTPQVVGTFATILDPLREDNWGENETRGSGVCVVGNEGEKVEKRSWLRVFF